LFLVSLAMLDANSQTVYRCGSVYSQIPCGEGKIVEATDPRSAAQRAEAKRVVADERRLAEDMRRDRLAEQAAIKPAGATSLSGPPIPVAKRQVAVARHQSKKKRRALPMADGADDFVAVDPAGLKRRSKK
jgi:hypothetical protein